MDMGRHRGVHYGLGLGLFLLVMLCGCQYPLQSPPLGGITLWDKEIQSVKDNLQEVLEGLREGGYLNKLSRRLQNIISARDRVRAVEAVRELQEHRAQLPIILGTVPPLMTVGITKESRLAGPQAIRILSGAPLHKVPPEIPRVKRVTQESESGPGLASPNFKASSQPGPRSLLMVCFSLTWPSFLLERLCHPLRKGV